MSLPHTIMIARLFPQQDPSHRTHWQLQDKYEYSADQRYVAG